MTDYAGESYRITAAATGFRGSALTEADVDAVTITVLDPGREVIVNEAVMVWSAEWSEWEYLLNTAVLTKGTYRYRVTVTDLEGNISFEWRRLRLAKPQTTA